MINNFLNNGNVGNIAYKKSQEAKAMITERWNNMGFLNGFSGSLKENMASIFENQATALLNEATTADQSGSFETVVFPLVRRIFSRLLASDIVSVQAMNLPVGKLFFIHPKTSERQWVDAEGKPMTATSELDGATGSHYGLMGYERTDRRNGNSVNRFYLPDEVVNLSVYEMYDEAAENEDGTKGAWVTLSATTYDKAVIDAKGAKVRQAAPEVVQYMKTSLYDLFYNDGLFDQSKGKVHIKVGTIAPVMLQGRQFVNCGDFQRFADDSIRNIMVKVTGFSKCGAGRIVGPDGNEMDTETFLASLKVVAKKPIVSGVEDKTKNEAGATFTSFNEMDNIPFRLVTQRYGRGIVEYNDACDAEGAIYLELDLAKPTKEMGVTFDGYIGVNPASVAASAVANTFMVAWSQYDSLELETEIAEVTFELSDVTVAAEERKLRATWSTELSQDVAAFHNIDAEAELTAILSEQVAAEIDREILRDLRVSPWVKNWDYNGWRRMGGFSTNYTQKDWNQTFVTAINQLSAQIHKATLRGGANFVIVSTELSALLYDLEYFHVTDASSEQVNYSMGIERIGSIQGKYQVYVDPYAPHWSAIIGHKGDSLLDTGYIYAPYVPMQLTPVMYNYNNFGNVRGIITRYAKKMVNNRFYGNIKASGLQTWDINELR